MQAGTQPCHTITGFSIPASSHASWEDRTSIYACQKASAVWNIARSCFLNRQSGSWNSRPLPIRAQSGSTNRWRPSGPPGSVCDYCSPRTRQPVGRHSPAPIRLMDRGDLGDTAHLRRRCCLRPRRCSAARGSAGGASYLSDYQLGLQIFCEHPRCTGSRHQRESMESSRACQTGVSVACPPTGHRSYRVDDCGTRIAVSGDTWTPSDTGLHHSTLTPQLTVESAVRRA